MLASVGRATETSKKAGTDKAAQDAALFVAQPPGHRHVCRHVYIYMHVDTPESRCVGIGVGMYAHMCIEIRTRLGNVDGENVGTMLVCAIILCMDMCVEMCADMRIDMYVRMCIDTYMDISMNLCMYLCT